jgi:hypothetical protein
MKGWSRVLMAGLMLSMSLVFVACSSESKDPAVAVCKEFIKKAATGDKTFKDMVDFEAAANRYGTSEKEIIQKEGQKKWEEVKGDMVKTIQSSFAPLKSSYKSSFKDFQVEEKGVDYTIVSYLNPAKDRKNMKVKKINGVMKAYFCAR